MECFLLFVAAQSLSCGEASRSSSILTWPVSIQEPILTQIVMMMLMMLMFSLLLIMFLIVMDTDSIDACESSDSGGPNNVLYQHYLREVKKLEKLKKQLAQPFKHKVKKSKIEKKPKDAFIRFSVSYFSSVIEALSDERRSIIESFGFGSLLKFRRCVVPNKFAQWVAHHVDYKSGDIVLNSKVIPITESVNLVLDLPIGGIPFSKDANAGKAAVLSRFNLISIPSVRLFGDRLLNNVDMSNEDVMVCFMIVALNCFLCPNSSLYPSVKYLGIFDDVFNLRNLDWCKFILEWLLAAIKSFNKGNKFGKEKLTLRGCLYFLTVYYLDCVDFGHRQVPPGIPRIVFWTDSMIRTYSDLDQVRPGIYGFRPLMDISSTCYSKQSVFMHKKASSLTRNSDFLQQLDLNSGGILPLSLKTSICKLIEQHNVNCSLSINMDMISDHCNDDEQDELLNSNLDRNESLSQNPNVLSQKEDDSNLDRKYDSPIHIPESPICNMKPVSEGANCGPSNYHNTTPSCIPSRNISKENDFDSNRFTTPGSSYNKNGDAGAAVLKTPHTNSNKIIGESFLRKDKQKCKADISRDFYTQSDISKLRDPLYELDNNVDNYAFINRRAKFVRENGERDIISLDNENECANEFFSPSSDACGSRYIFRKRNSVNPEDSISRSEQTPVHMQTLDDSDSSHEQVTPKLSLNRVTPCFRNCALKNSSPKTMQTKVPPEVQCTGVRILSQKQMQKPMTVHVDLTFEMRVENKDGNTSAQFQMKSSELGIQSNSAHHNVESEIYFHKSASTTGGKLPHYGPRRVIQPTNKSTCNQINSRSHFTVDQSEIQNYKAVLKLATSKWKENYVVDIGGVHCTFRSLGDSMKSGGIVSSFVVAIFCRHLFMKPNGHPDVSKKHYFFSNIGENLLKHPDDANFELLERSFNGSRKARPLPESNLQHWFLFIVDIKDQYFVFLDSKYGKDNHYQEHVRDMLIPSFMFHWDKIVEDRRDMRFDEYKVVYPPVPQQGNDNLFDSGIFLLI
ncbi:hypothetical protein ACP4OV_004250 [Aristida adscensionis]